MLVPPRGVGAPSSGKSWIRHWYPPIFGIFLSKTAWKWNKLDCSLNLCLSLSLNGWMAKSNIILSTLTCHVTVAEILFVRLGWIKSANSEKLVEQLNANSPFDWLYSHLTNSNSASVLLLNCHSAIQTQTQTEPEVFRKHAPTYYCGQISIKMKKKNWTGKGVHIPGGHHFSFHLLSFHFFLLSCNLCFFLFTHVPHFPCHFIGILCLARYRVDTKTVAISVKLTDSPE